MIRTWVIAAALLLACGNSKDAAPAPAPTPPPPTVAPPPAAPTPAPPGTLAEAPLTDAEFEAMMSKAVAMFEAMGKAVDSADDYCGRLADLLSKVFDDYQDFMAEAKQWKDSPYMDKKAEAWMKVNMDKVMPSMMKVGQAGRRCASDPKFAEVMKRMDELK